MSESVTASELSVIYKDDKPLWNFTATTAFPVEMPPKKNGQRPIVYIHLTPYTSDELKAILKKSVSGYRREKRDVEIVKEDRDIYTPLCDKHFVRMGNSTGTPVEQRAWLDKYPEFKSAFIEHTFGGLQMAAAASDIEDNDELFDISDALSGQVKVYQNLYDPLKSEIVHVDMTHNYTHPTEAQYREYRSARRSKFLRKSTLWTITEQHSVLERLYDAVIQSIDGAAVNGLPCAAVSKASWIADVPLWHKLWIVDQIFGELVEKND